MKCQNCKSLLVEDARFCSQCGQSTKDLNRPFWHLISESFFELFDIDGRLSSTLQNLLFKPGNLSSSYRAGRRVSYTPPLRIYLVTSLLLFFVMSLVKADYGNNQELISFIVLPNGLLEEIPKIMVVLLPIYALLLQISQPRSNYIFNLVCSVYIHTFWYFLFILFLLLQFLHSYIPSIIYLGWLIILYLVIYLVIAIKKFYGVSWLKSFIINVFTISI